MRWLPVLTLNLLAMPPSPLSKSTPWHCLECGRAPGILVAQRPNSCSTNCRIARLAIGLLRHTLAWKFPDEADGGGVGSIYKHIKGYIYIYIDTYSELQ